MGGPYNIPRNYKGENKILFIFSTKSFVYTAIGAFIGIIFYYIFNLLSLKIIGFIFIALFAAIGFVIGTMKVPEMANLKFTQKVGGENIDKVIIRWIKFKKNKKKIYIYKKEEHKDE